MTQAVLWDYPNSSASYRVRIALNLAGVDYRSECINLVDEEHKSPTHLDRNPQGLVPVLEIDGHRLTQSLAIIEYLDEVYDLKFLPADPVDRARVRALAYCLAVDVHPICNMSVARHATGGHEPARSAWMHHFIRPGLLAFENMLAAFNQTPFCVGSSPTLADLCLIPQLYNARRWNVDYSDCHRIKGVSDACAEITAFSSAAPEPKEAK